VFGNPHSVFQKEGQSFAMAQSNQEEPQPDHFGSLLYLDAPVVPFPLQVHIPIKNREKTLCELGREFSPTAGPLFHISDILGRRGNQRPKRLFVDNGLLT